jgi:hypothetical protein
MFPVRGDPPCTEVVNKCCFVCRRFALRILRYRGKHVLRWFRSFLFIVFIKFIEIVRESGEFYFIAFWSYVFFGKLLLLAKLGCESEFPVPTYVKLTNSVTSEPEGSSPHSQQPATGPYP